MFDLHFRQALRIFFTPSDPFPFLFSVSIVYRSIRFRFMESASDFYSTCRSLFSHRCAMQCAQKKVPGRAIHYDSWLHTPRPGASGLHTHPMYQRGCPLCIFFYSRREEGISAQPIVVMNCPHGYFSNPTDTKKKTMLCSIPRRFG